jgi:hypothetical protein
LCCPNGEETLIPRKLNLNDNNGNGSNSISEPSSGKHELKFEHELALSPVDSIAQLVESICPVR